MQISFHVIYHLANCVAVANVTQDSIITNKSP